MKILHRGQVIGDLGKKMLDKPNDFMIDSEGKLYSKCGCCTEWHLISELNFKYSDDE